MQWTQNPNKLDPRCWILRFRGKRRDDHIRLSRFCPPREGEAFPKNRGTSENGLDSCSEQIHLDQAGCQQTTFEAVEAHRSPESGVPLAVGSMLPLAGKGRAAELDGNSRRTDAETAVENLLQKLIKFQARLGREQRRKLKAHKRYVCGMRECMRLVQAERCLLLIVSLDQPEDFRRGKLEKLLCLAQERRIPICRIISANRLTQLLRRVQSSRSRSRLVCCLGIRSCEGAVTDMRCCLAMLDSEAETLYPEVPP